MKPYNTKMEERLVALRDTLDLKEPKKVPVNIQVQTWAYAYAGVTLKEVVDDPVKDAGCYTKLYDDIEVDLSTFGVNVMPIRLFEALDITKYCFANDDTAIVHQQVGEDYFGMEFYDDIKEIGVEGITEKIRRMNIPVLSEPKEVAVKRFEEATKNVKNYIEMKQMASHKIDELGIPRIFDAGTNSCDAAFLANPFTKLMDYYRGMKNALIDLRRCPDKVEEACDVIAEYNGKRLLSDTEEIKKSFEGNVVSLGMNILNAECFLSRQNFERFYLKYFRKQLMPYIDAVAKFYIYMEGDLLKTCDMYNDLPKGALFRQPDTDDPFELYKKIGGYHTICAGAPLSMLKYETKENCIDYAKKCFDTFAPGGGYVFSHNKSLTCAKDVNIENFKAVYEFANEYGRKQD